MRRSKHCPEVLPDAPPAQRGWKKTADGRIVSNGCSCQWRQVKFSYANVTFGEWDSWGCPLHGEHLRLEQPQ